MYGIVSPRCANVGIKYVVVHSPFDEIQDLFMSRGLLILESGLPNVNPALVVLEVRTNNNYQSKAQLKKKNLQTDWSKTKRYKNI